MLDHAHKADQPSGEVHECGFATCFTAAVLAKLAKHFAILASFTILGGATSRIAVSQLAIFTLIVLAVLSHAIGRTLELRLRKQTAPNKGVP